MRTRLEQYFLKRKLAALGPLAACTSIAQADAFAARLRRTVRASARLPEDASHDSESASMREFAYLLRHHRTLAPYFQAMRQLRVLFSGQAYYNHWHLSRALRARGLKADLLNWDTNPASQIFYHGEDFRFSESTPLAQQLRFYLNALYAYDIYHFANTFGMCFGFSVQNTLSAKHGTYADVRLLKKLGKHVIYGNNGCHDGVTPTSFAKWGPDSVCAICRWRDFPSVCSDTRMHAWGKLRNEIADYQCLLGGNRADYNRAPTVHECPAFYCLDADFWKPGLAIPEAYRFQGAAEGTVWLYHAVGNMKERTDATGVNIKSTHIYLPLIEKFKAEGMAVALCSPENVPNKEVRFLQAQCDIFLEMLSFGWFGANAREAMMLGKVVVCFLRPEWLESLRRELPEYAAELPIVQATPATVEAVLRELIANPQLRHEIGQKSRAFCEKWHGTDYAAAHFEKVYRALQSGDPLLVEHYA